MKINKSIENKSTKSQRFIGIDYGSKRIGVAISDESLKFALPLVVIKNTELSAKEIQEIGRQYETNKIVMGESRNYRQEPNPIFEESVNFKKVLEKLGFSVELELEFMTSVNAERFQGKTEMTDASAAALILQSYLDRQKR